MRRRLAGSFLIAIAATAFGTTLSAALTGALASISWLCAGVNCRGPAHPDTSWTDFVTRLYVEGLQESVLPFFVAALTAGVLADTLGLRGAAIGVVLASLLVVVTSAVEAGPGAEWIVVRVASGIGTAATAAAVVMWRRSVQDAQRAETPPN